MKKGEEMKGKYIALIVAGGMILAGALIGVASASAYAFNMDKMFTTEVNTLNKTYEINDKFDSIEAEGAAIVIAPSEDGTSHVDTVENRYYTFSVNVIGETLKIKTERQGSWMDMIFNGFEGPSATIYVSETELKKLNVNNDSNSTTVNEGFVFENASVDNGSGSIKFYSDVEGKLYLHSGSGSTKVENINAGETVIENGSGSVTVSGIKGGNISAKSGSGSVTVENADAKDIYIKSGSGTTKAIGCVAENLIMEGSSGSATVEDTRVSGDAEIRKSSGSIHANRITADNLRVKNGSGSIGLSDAVIENKVVLEGSSGSIRFENSDGKDITIENGSGSITASLLSTKEISANSGSGSVKVPDLTEGEKNGLLRAHSSSGSINISYSK